MDPVTKYALELVEELAAGYRRALDPHLGRTSSVTLDADTLAFPLECIVAKIRTRQDEQDRIKAV